LRYDLENTTKDTIYITEKDLSKMKIFFRTYNIVKFTHYLKTRVNSAAGDLTLMGT